MPDHFKVKSITNLDELTLGQKLDESDFALASQSNKFIQFEHVAENKDRAPYLVEPGIFSIIQRTDVLSLEKTSFVKEDILESYSHIENISKKITNFFNKFDVYKKYGIEIPKRGMLLFGPPGTSKTTSLKFVANKYAADGKTAIIVWGTDRIGPGDVKDFIKTFAYKGVEKLILIMEDLGGVEMDEVKVKSQSSLLSLLDNQEKTFSIPILILATTNHIEIFNSSLTNRPGRFNDKIEVGFPNKKERQELFKFFLKDKSTEELIDKVGDNKYKEMTPAHIQEILIRSELYDLTIEESLEQILYDINQFKKLFQNKKNIGITDDYYD